MGRPYLAFRDSLSAKGLCIIALFRIIVIPIVIVFYDGMIVNDILLNIVTFLHMSLNGYLSAMTMVKYPMILKNHEQELGAALMQLAYASGLTIGSLIAVLLLQLFAS